MSTPFRLTSLVEEVLTWSGIPDTLIELHLGFSRILEAKLGETLAMILCEDANMGERLSAKLRSLDDHGFSRFLAAPEVVYRLLQPGRHRLRDIGSFFQDSMDAEELLTQGGTSDRPVWTAAGDVFMNGDTPVRPTFTAFPLDFSSPFVQERAGSNASLKCVPLAPQERMSAITQITGALEQMGRVNRFAAGFVSTHIKSLAIRGTLDSGRCFLSRSSTTRIGSITLYNIDRAGEHDVLLVEALLHEAIHTALHMEEAWRQSFGQYWITEPTFRDGADRIVSPWTGRYLPLENFLHAVFVWFGLVTFWSQAFVAFPCPVVKERLAFCTAGFLQKTFSSQFDSVRSVVADDVIDAVHSVAAVVAQCSQVLD